METKVVQLRARGTLTLPARLRERYSLQEGDPLTIVDLDGVLVLAPRVSIVTRLAGEIERLREEAGLTEEDLLSGLPEERRRYLEERGDGEA